MKSCVSTLEFAKQNLYVYSIELSGYRSFKYDDFFVKALNKKDSKRFLAVFLIGEVIGHQARLWDGVFGENQAEEYEQKNIQEGAESINMEQSSSLVFQSGQRMGNISDSDKINGNGYIIKEVSMLNKPNKEELVIQNTNSSITLHQNDADKDIVTYLKIEEDMYFIKQEHIDD